MDTKQKYSSNLFGQPVRYCRKVAATNALSRRLLRIIPIFGTSTEVILEIIAHEFDDCQWLFALYDSGAITAYQVPANGPPYEQTTFTEVYVHRTHGYLTLILKNRA